MSKIYLCNEKRGSIQITVTAEIIGDCLKISGQDIGDSCKAISGDNEYEYFYSFDNKNTQKLNTLLRRDHGEIDFGNLLLNNFSGIDGCKKLRELCNVNSITFSFFSC